VEPEPGRGKERVNASTTEEPVVKVRQWEEPSVARTLGTTWEGRRERHRWSNERYRMALLLRNNLLPGQDVVDVGCGPGFYVPHYLDRVGPAHTHPVDQSNQMLAYCRERYPALRPENLVPSSIYRLPFPDGRFDGVVNCDVLMHIPHYRKALAELYRICNPRGGRIFLRINLTDGPTYGDLPEPGRDDPDYIYWIAYGRPEFAEALRELGPASVTLIDRICRKPLKRRGDPFVASAAIVIVTRGEARRRLRLGTRLGHLLRKAVTLGS
jgi:SAM-dependent methyltransferase